MPFNEQAGLYNLIDFDVPLLLPPAWQSLYNPAVRLYRSDVATNSDTTTAAEPNWVGFSDAAGVAYLSPAGEAAVDASAAPPRRLGWSRSVPTVTVAGHSTHGWATLSGRG